MASTTWKPPANGPTTIAALRTALTVLAKKKTGKALIDAKFTNDHKYAGHAGSLEKLATAMAQLDEKSLSKIMISSMDKTAQAEVLNWIRNVPPNKVTYSGGKWTLSTSGSSVTAANSYKFANVDLEALRGMKPDERIRKSRKWLTESSKTPKVACQFGSDGTPMIYQLYY